MNTKLIATMLCITGLAFGDAPSPTATAARLRQMANEYENHANVANNLRQMIPQAAYLFYSREVDFRQVALRLRIEADLAEGKDVSLLKARLTRLEAEGREAMLDAAASSR